ncbi:hypothetical protein PR048_013744 [Dryococelus australis]|uniref:Uncharacterized protein n=1 Tax=Dryococelus australis TaxID=614101 RepID=A0ABQ9HUL2_9NEOP|nr:hypothetical protein PR048_013744 [Dryococelus australis]
MNLPICLPRPLNAQTKPSPRVCPAELRPYPKAGARKKTMNRRCRKSLILTTTHVKKSIELEDKERNEKEKRKVKKPRQTTQEKKIHVEKCPLEDSKPRQTTQQKKIRVEKCPLEDSKPRQTTQEKKIHVEKCPLEDSKSEKERGIYLL